MVEQQPEKTFQDDDSTSQDELEQLLQQSRGVVPRTAGVRLPTGGGRPNFLLWGIVFLTVVLLISTGYFVFRSLGFSRGTVVFELNEEGVLLAVDNRSYGTINSGDKVQLKTGQHTVNLSKEGFLEIEQELNLPRGEEVTLQAELLPIPVLKLITDKKVEYPRLNADGSEISYFNPDGGLFQSVNLTTGQVTNLFRGSFSAVQEVVWSPTNQAAIVKLAGSPKLTNTLDNRSARGAYVVLGERPMQGPANFQGVSTWLFDDAQRTAGGWQPIRLSDSIRETAFSADGSSILYIYEPANGEYSLVRALPDGQEWERVVDEMSRLTNPLFTWGQDDRYVLIENQGKLSVGDLIAGNIPSQLGDWMPGSHFAISPGGDQLVYLAQTGTSTQVKMFDLLSSESKVIFNGILDVKQDSTFVWTGVTSMMFSGTDQKLVSVDIDKESKLSIPFVGATGALHIRALQYSPLGRVLMVVADEGIFTMNV